MSTERSSFLDYRPDIDGLRAIAIISVVLYHAQSSFLKGGFLGVDVFFVISGYLISLISFKSLDNKKFSLAQFFIKRLYRILPALLIVLLVTLFFGYLILLADELRNLIKHTLGALTFSSNFLLSKELGYFDTSSESKPLLHLWSLSIEVQFYFLWPFFLIAFRRIPRFTIHCLLAMLVFSFLWSQHASSSNSSEAFFSLQSRAWELIAGSITAWITMYLPHLKINNSFKNLREIVSIAAVLLILIPMFIVTPNVAGYPGMWVVPAVVGTALVIYVGPVSWVNKTILSNKYLVGIGLLSYSLYLWHWPIFSFAKIYTGSNPGIWIAILLIIVSLFLSYATLHLLEFRFRDPAYPQRKKIKTLISATVTCLTAVFLLFRSDLKYSHNIDTLSVKRSSFAYGVGHSFRWIQGYQGWLFLGNEYDSVIEKVVSGKSPSQPEIAKIYSQFASLASDSASTGVKLGLMISPNKHLVYSEYLPEKLLPSKSYYISFFLKELSRIPNLYIYYPGNDFLRLKTRTDNLLYYKTDTHWNYYGAYSAFKRFARMLELKIPDVYFVNSKQYRGDLLDLSHEKNIVTPEIKDSFDPVFGEQYKFSQVPIHGANLTPTSFGSRHINLNENPIEPKVVWVVGDSVTGALRPFLNATFSEVHYLGHWKDLKDSLGDHLKDAKKKPDFLLIFLVERSF